MVQAKVIHESEYGPRHGQSREVLIALGSNCRSEFGKPLEILERALGSLGEMGITVERVSQFYRSPAFPAGSGPDFVNAVMAGSSNLAILDVMAVLAKVEDNFGRKRAKRWGPRTLDLDLIGIGDLVVPDEKTQSQWRDLSILDQQTKVPEQLILPHPRVQDRAFVLVPLNDVAPSWVHPVLGRTAVKMLGDLPENDVQAMVLMSPVART